MQCNVTCMRLAIKLKKKKKKYSIDSIIYFKIQPSLTARPSTDSIEQLPFSSFFEGFIEELESENVEQ